MPRPTRPKRPEEEVPETLEYVMRVRLPVSMRRFLEVEAKRMTDKKLKGTGKGKSVLPQDIIRALVAAYYEKRMIGLLVDPND